VLLLDSSSKPRRMSVSTTFRCEARRAGRVAVSIPATTVARVKAISGVSGGWKDGAVRAERDDARRRQEDTDRRRLPAFFIR
jgi:hypothetical protein